MVLQVETVSKMTHVLELGPEIFVQSHFSISNSAVPTPKCKPPRPTRALKANPWTAPVLNEAVRASMLVEWFQYCMLLGEGR